MEINTHPTRIANAVLLTLAMAASLLLSSCSQNITLGPKNTTITVNGHGSVTVEPDLWILTLSVHTEKIDPERALSENNAATRELIETIRSFGVDQMDIKTTDFNVWKSGQKGLNPAFQLTMVNNTVVVTVRDTTKIGPLLDAVTMVGNTQVSGIQFDLEDKTALMQQAREKAMANATVVADELASVSGYTLGPISTIVYIDDPIGKINNYKGAEGRANSGIQIFSGVMTVSTNVIVTYQVK